MSFPTPVELIAATAMIAAGSCVQGSIGFGLALVAAPVLAIINPMLAPGPVLLCAFVLTVMMSHRERGGIELRPLGWAVSGRVIGTIPAASLIALLPKETMMVVFGAVVLLAAVCSALGARFRPDSKSLLIAGAAAGFMGTISAIGGPPMALVYQDSPGWRLRGMLSAFFVVGSAMSMTGLALVGRFGWPEIQAGLLMLPGMFAGYCLSMKLNARLDGGALRPAILVACSAAGAFVIVQSIL